MILVVDNYDSFVFNLARYLTELGARPEVLRNDAFTLDEAEAMQPEAVVISPGPGGPDDAGISCAVVERFAGRVPVLGVCLGHLCIGQVFGGRVVRAQRPMHGRSSLVGHDGRGVFHGLPNPLRVGRYHSLVLDPDRIPTDLEVCATSPEGEVMAVRHRRWPVIGVQFHPEAVLTEYGYDLLSSFLRSPSRPRPGV